MAGFKVGDKVRCIEPFQWARGPYGPRIDVGDERTIEAINENDTLNCYSPDGEYECWNLSRFEAVPVTGVDALGLTILPDGCGERPPEWVRILSRVEPSCEIAEHRVVKVIGWDERGPRVRCSHGSFSPSSWVPADPPEPNRRRCGCDRCRALRP